MAVKLGHYNDLKVGRFLNVDGEPCKVVDIQISSTGKHGHAKGRITTIGVFDGQKRQVMGSMHSGCEIPLLEKKSAQVVAILADKVQLMDLQSFETFDILIPEELKDKISAGVEVEYTDYDGRRMINRTKSAGSASSSDEQ